jgi:AraC-like DNA-binding protein
MERQSFATWQLPRALEAVLQLEDLQDRRIRYPARERHFHDELELHFVDRGSGVFLLTESRLTAPAGTLLWIPPGRDHVLLEATTNFRRWMLLCRPQQVRRVLPKDAHRSLLTSGAVEQSGRVQAPVAAALRQTFIDVSRDRGAEISLFNAAVSFALARAWTTFEKAQTIDAPVSLHPAVAAAVRLLREATARPSLPDLAASVGLTESHLSKLFAAEVGMSITEFRNRVGVERFLEIYGDGSARTLLDAALEAGFGSYPQFHRVFRNIAGYSPREHRRRA